MNIIDFIFSYIEVFFIYFGVKNDTERTAALIIAGVYLFIIILRIITSLNYQSKYAMFKLTGKEIPNKTDIPKIGGTYLPRLIKDYTSLGEHGVGDINVSTIVAKTVQKSSILGWKLSSVERFIETLESSVLFAGIFVIILFENKLFFGVGILCIFAVTRLFASLFDYTTTKDKLLRETEFYLQKELGKFYISDTSNAITKLKLELKTLMTNQAKIIDDSIKNLINELSKAVSVSMESVVHKTDDSVARLAAQALVVTEPMAKWAQTLDKANIAQETLNSGIEKLNTSITGIANGTGAIDGLLSGFAEKITANSKNLDEQVTRLISSVSDLKEVGAAVAVQSESATEDMKYIRTNQAALERAVSQYEVTLKDITGQMGDAFGKIVDFHMQGTYNALNDGIQSNIKQLAASNNELLERMQSLFEQMQQQSKSETETILRVKEQIEMYMEMRPGDSG